MKLTDAVAAISTLISGVSLGVALLSYSTSNRSAEAAGKSADAATRSADAASKTLKAAQLGSIAQSVAARNIALFVQRAALDTFQHPHRKSAKDNIRVYDTILRQMDEIRYDLVDQRLIEPMLKIKIHALSARAAEDGEAIDGADDRIMNLRQDLRQMDATLGETNNVYFGEACQAFVGSPRPEDDPSCVDLRGRSDQPAGGSDTSFPETHSARDIPR